MNPNVAISGRAFDAAGAAKVLPLRCDHSGRLLTAAPRWKYIEFISAGAGAYAAGDAVGELQTVENVTEALLAQQASLEWDRDDTVMLDSITVFDDAGQAVDGVLLFFSGGNMTVTDNEPFAWNLGGPSCVGKLTVSQQDYEIFDGKAVATFGNAGIMLKLSGGTTTLYVAFVTKGTPTYGVGGKLRAYLGFRRG